MSIDQTNVIDAISKSPKGEIVLTISDHHPWDNTWHLQLLQDKINAYLQFIEGGQIPKGYITSAGKEIIIDTVFRHQPTKEVISFLTNAKEVIVRAELDFQWRLLNFDE